MSNHLLGYAPDPAGHPFPHYLRAGVPVCLNTDDRGAFDSNLTDEYFLAATLFHLSWPEVVLIGRQSLEFSFAETALKNRLLTRYDIPGWRSELRSIHPNVSGYAFRNLRILRRDMIARSN